MRINEHLTTINMTENNIKKTVDGFYYLLVI